MNMGVGSEGAVEDRATLDFIHGTDIVDRGLIVLFSVLAIFRAFFRCPPPPEIFLPTPLIMNERTDESFAQLS